jgi:DNA modification methylase
MHPTATLIHGDSLTVLTAENGPRDPATDRRLKADAAITDPPYNVSLDGDREWDDFQTDRYAETDKVFMNWTTKWSRPLLTEVLWPGSLLAAFSAHRTVHALMFGVQDAGYSIFDVAIWLYATGQVKHKNKLKPAYEPVVLARTKPLQGGSIDQLNKLFKDKGRGLLHTQEIKAEDGRHPMNVEVAETELVTTDDDIRGMSKFLYVAKPSRTERDYGCDALAVRSIEGGLAGNMGKSSVEARNIHPTVKPIDLMRRLVRMLTKPGATVIDPFMGSGTTGIACMLEGRNFIGIEREAEFFEIATHRINAAKAEAAA